MVQLTRWEPFRDLLSFQERMNRLFEDTLGPRSSEDLLTTGTFVPACDVYEDEHSLIVKMEVAGIDEKDIDVRLENNTLTVRGERKFEKEEKEENFHRIERRYGAFSRAFTLPNTVDTDKVEAHYENGVLKIRLAKKAEARPKQVKVNVTSKQIEGKTGGKAA